MKKLIAVLLAGGLVFGLVGSASAGKATTVWKDDAGDADNAQGLGTSIPGGFDLVGGSIARNGANLDFTVTHADMPPTGTLPEGFRFLWAFAVDGKTYRLTIKRTDVGKPDLGQNQTTERVGRVDVNGHFRLEGDCGSTAAPAVLVFVNCKPLAYLEGTWDPASKSVTMTVPMKLIKAKTGSKIGPGSGEALTICAICWVTHLAERSFAATIIDSAAQTATYKVPR